MLNFTLIKLCVIIQENLHLICVKYSIIKRFIKFKPTYQNIFELTASTYIIFGILYILIFNLINYSIFDGYDADAHIAYVDFIAMYLPYELKLPLHKYI